jgi:hypothetical protein
MLLMMVMHDDDDDDDGKSCAVLAEIMPKLVSPTGD